MVSGIWQSKLNRIGTLEDSLEDSLMVSLMVSLEALAVVYYLATRSDYIKSWLTGSGANGDLAIGCSWQVGVKSS